MVGCVDKLTKRAVTGGSGHAKSKKWFAWRQNCSNSNFPSRKFRTAERCHPIQRKYNERVSCLSRLDIVWLYWSCFQLGKTSIQKKTFLSSIAQKKTFFCIDVFSYSLQCDFDCFVAPTFIQITIFSLRLRFQRAQCGETLIVGSSYTPLAETKTTFKYVLYYVPGYSKKSTTSFFQNYGRVIQAVPKSLTTHLIVRATWGFRKRKEWGWM